MKVKSVVSGSIPAIIHRNSLGHIAPSVSPCLAQAMMERQDIKSPLTSEHFNDINYKTQ